MRFKGRCISGLSAGAIVALGLTACGSSSDTTVARVAGVGTISKAMVEHWIPIEARILYSEVPTRPIPSGVVPDPPTYTACVAYFKVTPQKVTEHPDRQTTARLRGRCAHREQELKELTVNTLIGWNWAIGRGLRIGITVTDAEARQRLEALKRIDFPSRNYDKYLKYSGQTASDMLLRAKVQVVESKLSSLQRGLLRGGQSTYDAGQRRVAVGSFAAKLLTDKQWAERTTCLSGYVVSGCREYTGSQPPGLPN